MRRASLWGIIFAFLVFLSPSNARAQVCQGDCTLDANVTVDELATIVSMALGAAPAGACLSGDLSCDGTATVDEIVAAADNALNGCGHTFATRGELVEEPSLPEGFLRQIPGGPALGGKPQMPAQYRVDSPDEFEVRVFVRDLQVPWAMAFAPDGRLFINERPGRIRTVTDGNLDPTPWATVTVNASTSEGGLMGLALDPQFAQEPWVYVCYTRTRAGNIANRISRLRQVEGGGIDEQILVDDIRGASIHDGCRLKFGPDGMLYASTGDAAARATAQELSSPNGKILRIRPDGLIPSDNPFGPDSYVYTYGHRNPQGLAFRADGMLFETEHGPSGEVSGLRAHDEVNVIQAGKNYGWPSAVGAPQLPQFVDPILLYPDSAVPPAGATFYQAPAIRTWTGNFFFTSLGAQRLQRVVLDQCDRVAAIEWLLSGSYGRLRDVIQGPDGSLYVATSNRDGRGRPAGDDDRILQDRRCRVVGLVRLVRLV